MLIKLADGSYETDDILLVEQLDRIGERVMAAGGDREWREGALAALALRERELRRSGLTRSVQVKAVEGGNCMVGLLGREERFMFLPGVDVQVLRPAGGRRAVVRTVRLSSSQGWALGSFILTCGPLCLTGKISRSSRMWRGGPRLTFLGRPALVPCLDQGTADMLDLAFGLGWTGLQGSSRHDSNPIVQGALQGFRQLFPDLLDANGDLGEVRIVLPPVLERVVRFPLEEATDRKAAEAREGRRAEAEARRARRESLRDVDPAEAGLQD